MKSFKTTKIACYIGFFTQAVIINLAPVLFVVFKGQFGLSYEELGRLILINFAVQITTDVVSLKVLERVPVRIQLLTAHILCFSGLVGMAVLPNILPPYAGLVCSVVLYSVGGGLIEVLLNPVVSHLPETNTKVEIPLLHSFYCWGHLLTCLLSTVYLYFSDNWRVLPILWSLVPLTSTVMFAKAPLPEFEKGKERTPIGKLLKSKAFLTLMLVMVCSGAAEQAVAQWVSYFAEIGLQIPKIYGDVIGVCGFALCMALCRMLYGIFGERFDIKKVLLYSSILCIVSYALICLVNSPVVSLIGCVLCGVSVALMWPGTVAGADEDFPHGGAVMFALLSVMGDVGCSAGPWITGLISDAVEKNTSFFENLVFFDGMAPDQIALKCGIFVIIIFPVTMALCLSHYIRNKYK